MGVTTLLTRSVSRPLLRLRVLRTERVSPTFQRVTLGRDDIAGFTATGWGQWLRLVLPDAHAAALPGRLTPLDRVWPRHPTVRSWAVRAYRAVGHDGPELDLDFALHDHEGIAATWARAAGPGDVLAVADAGPAFDPARGDDHVLLVADETGVPSVAGVLACLPDDATGTAVLEVPSIDDTGPLPHPPGVEVVWLSRDDEPAGATALHAAQSLGVDRARLHAFVAGEHTLARGLRRHLLSRGVPRVRITASTHWRHGPAQRPTDS